MSNAEFADRYDVVIVGARCSGATLGTLLAREGLRTLVLEAGALGTDQVMSTHYLQPPGVAVLSELGLGDRLRASTPLTRRFAVEADGVRTVSSFPEGHGGYCVRRHRLDSWLQETAQAAGAIVRDHSRVTDLVFEGERVAGVVVETPSGKQAIRAGLVVGADGPHSIVAKRTKVEEYLGFDSTRGGYWFYFPMNDAWKNERPFDGVLSFQGDDLRYIFQTDDEQLLMIATTPLAEAKTWGRDYKKKTLELLRSCPTTAPYVEGVEPVGKGVGVLGPRFFYRRPVGPGFALVGDAGNFKDFVTGQGMTDALLGAKKLAHAILDGREEAFEHYWRERDVETLPLYLDAARLGEVGANDAMMRLVFENLGKDATLRDRPALVSDRKISPFEALPMSALLRWVLGATLRGRFDVLPAFLRTGKKMAGYQKELAHRVALLREAEEKLANAPKRAGAQKAPESADLSPMFA